MMRVVVLILALLAAGSTVSAQENLELGKMWPFEAIPGDYFESTYGWKPDQAWLDSVRLSSIRFGRGCSSSFVSPSGLIMTNHHCARDAIATASPDGTDWVRDGFVATALDDEVKLEGLTVQQLQATRDVTAAMNAGIAADAAAAAADAKRAENRRGILAKASEEFPGAQAEVVSLYQGGLFSLYVYRVFDDIRLVAAPHLQAAYFGGDHDNFTYPRYCLDFAFCRAYANGVPADTSGHYFRWSTGGAKAGELVFTTGNPGSTGRAKTLAQLEYRRDVYYPLQIETIRNRIAGIESQLAANPDQEKVLREQLFSLGNSLKAFTGYLDGLRDETTMQAKLEAETAFRKKVLADEKLATEYGDVWERLGEIAKERSVLMPRQSYYDVGGLTTVLAGAYLARALDPDAPERTRNRMMGALEQLPIGDDADARARFAARATEALTRLPADDPYAKALRSLGETPAAAIETLTSSKIADEAFRKTIVEGGAEAVASAKDPSLVLGRVLLDGFLEARARMQALDASERTQQVRLGQAIHAVYGSSVSPDATLTLRLSDGVVKGYDMNGTIAPPMTRFLGMYARALEFGNDSDWALPDPWLMRQRRVDVDVAVNMVSTNDIIGGNSGSPLINKNKEVVGLVFDGNIEMLGNRYLYRDDIPRTVSVHSDAILESLRTIYDAQRVVDELLGR